MKPILNLIMALLLSTAVACSSSGTTDATSTDTDLGSAGAMVAAAFSSSGSASINQSLLMPWIRFFVSQAQAQQGDTNTCEEGGQGPSNVTTTLTGAVGTYGSASDSVTITSSDDEFCKDSDGNFNDNPDDLLFASFSVSSATITCSDSATATMQGTGIWRNRDDLGLFPQIYGSFTITTTEGSAEVDCSIALDGNSTVSSASCTDTDGTSVSLSEDITCTIDAGDE